MSFFVASFVTVCLGICISQVTADSVVMYLSVTSLVTVSLIFASVTPLVTVYVTVSVSQILLESAILPSETCQ